MVTSKFLACNIYHLLVIYCPNVIFGNSVNKKLKIRLIIYPIILITGFAYAVLQFNSSNKSVYNSSGNTQIAFISVSKHPNLQAQPSFLLVTMAKLGSTESQLSLAKFYIDNNQFANAEPWANKIYASNDPAALSNLSIYYLLKNRSSKALKFLQKGAYKLKNPTIMAQLGRLYFVGTDGVKPDDVKAEKLLKASANMNNALGQYLLGLFYLGKGKFALAKNNINLALPRLPKNMRQEAIQTLNKIKQAEDAGAEKLLHTLTQNK